MSQELFAKYTKFIKSIHEMNMDQISVIILCIILLLTPDRVGLAPSSIEYINRQQEKYLLLLQRYMTWKFGHAASSVLFPNCYLNYPTWENYQSYWQIINWCCVRKRFKVFRVNATTIDHFDSDEGSIGSRVTNAVHFCYEQLQHHFNKSPE